jgi:hypothetical protein
MSAISRRQRAIHAAPFCRSCAIVSNVRPSASSFAFLSVNCCQRWTITSTHLGSSDAHESANEPDQSGGTRLIHRGPVFEVVEHILNNCGATIHHDQTDRAFYNRASDSIHLPPKHAFKDAASYYGTALHEGAHSSGHPSR